MKHELMTRTVARQRLLGFPAGFDTCDPLWRDGIVDLLLVFRINGERIAVAISRFADDLPHN